MAETAHMVAVYDRGNTLVCMATTDQVQKMLTWDNVEVIRSRKGIIQRIYWRAPEPEPEPIRNLTPASYTGTRYSYYGPVWPGFPLPKAWQFRDLHTVKQEEILAVTVSIAK